ncbi:MAG: glycosyltransferase family 4 protein, partial [Cytophagales bacterium]
MKILYVHQYFKTPSEGGAVRSYYLAKSLVEEGHEVVMLTAHNQKNILETNVEGIQVIYLPVFYANKLGFLGRAFAFLKFIYLAFKKASKIEGLDLCYCTSTPLTVGLIALWLKKKKNIPFYFEVRDLWPEAPIQMGAITNPVLIYFLKKLELDLYVKAERLIALSPGMRDGINQMVPGKAVSVLPNMADISFFRAKIDRNEAFERFGNELKNSFNIAYIGAIGKVNRMDALLDAAFSCLKANFNVQFLVAGEGAALERTIQKAHRMGLKNLKFLGHLNKNEVRMLLNISQATYLSFCDKPVLGTNSPNKF